MLTKSRWLRVLALLLGLSLLAAACGDDDSGSASNETSTTEGGGGNAPAGGTLVDLQNFASGEPDHIDPGLAGVLQGAQIGQLLYDGLTEFDFSDPANPELKGQVASDWKTDDDGKTWVFTIKPDQVFSNGEPVLPSSFARGWNRFTNPDFASEIAYLADPIQGAAEMADGSATELSGVVADDNAMTLTVTLNEAFADFPAVVSHPVFSPMPTEVDDLSDQTQWEQGVMIGNGPFMQKDPWQHEQEIDLVRNPKWNGGIEGDGAQAQLDEIDFKISKDLDSAYADFESGAGQTGYIPSGRFAEATGKYPHATDPTLGIYQFYINQESQLGGDANLKLREAIAMAIDRDSINQTVYDGSRQNATGMTPPGIPGYQENLCGDLCTYNPDKAKTLVDEWKAAGGTLDHPIKINVNTGSGHEDVVAIMQANLAAIGLDAEIDGRDPTTYFSEMRKGACEFCRGGWIWDYPVYDNAAYALLDSASIDGDNLGRLNSPKVDEDISQARQTVDDQKRFELYRDAEKIALEQVAVVPINWYTGQIVYTDKVQNFVQTPLQFVNYQDVTLAG